MTGAAKGHEACPDRCTPGRPWARAAFDLSLVGVLCAIFISLSLSRLIAKDEGFYAIAAKLILEGRTPYLDFFYPQMPLLPYLYAGVFRMAGCSWEAGRIFSALLTAATAYLLYLEVRRRMGLCLGLAAALLFSLSNFVFPWYLTIKTYALSTLLLFACYVVLSRAVEKTAGSRFGYLGAGLLLGAAIDTRLFFAGITPALLLFIALREKGHAVRPLSLFCAGLALALLPNAVFLAVDAQSFYFNNLGYHLSRASADQQRLSHKWETLSKLLAIRSSRSFAALQIPLLIALNAAAFLLVLARRKPIDACFYISACLLALNLTPSPPYLQYFCVLVPFLIIPALEVLQAHDAARAAQHTAAAAAISLCFLVIYFRGISADLTGYTKSGYGVVGVKNSRNAGEWTLSRMRAVAEAIDSQVHAGAPVSVDWPGYLLNSAAKPLPGMENHFAEHAADALSAEFHSRYRLLSREKHLIAAAVLLRPA